MLELPDRVEDVGMELDLQRRGGIALIKGTELDDLYWMELDKTGKEERNEYRTGFDPGVLSNGDARREGDFGAALVGLRVAVHIVEDAQQITRYTKKRLEELIILQSAFEKSGVSERSEETQERGVMADSQFLSDDQVSLGRETKRNENATTKALKNARKCSNQVLDKD